MISATTQTEIQEVYIMTPGCSAIPRMPARINIILSVVLNAQPPDTFQCCLCQNEAAGRFSGAC